MSSRLSRFAAVIGLVLGLSLVSQPTVRGDEPKHRAVMAAELRPSQLMKSTLVQSLFKEAPDQVQKFMAAESISAAMSLPSNVMDLFMMQPNQPIPFDFYVKIKFPKIESRQALLPDELLENLELVNSNGRSYYQGPFKESNMVLFVDDALVEFGTQDYLLRDDRDVLTPQLKLLQSDQRPAPLQFCLDLDGDRQFFDQAMAFVRDQQPPAMVSPYLDVPSKLSNLSLTVDPTNNTLVDLQSTSPSEKDAQYVDKAINSLIGLAQFSIGKSATPSQDFALALLKSVKREQKANSTHSTLSKPDKFDQMVESVGREAAGLQDAATKANRFKQFMLSIHNYEATFNKFPFRDDRDGRTSDQLSWRVYVLPFMEGGQLYDQFDMSAAWDAEANKDLLDQIPEHYGKNGLTDVCWVISDAEGFRNITDGTSSTICLVQFPAGVRWTEPKDLEIDQVMKLVKELPDGQKLVVGLYDGSVREISNQIDQDLLHDLLTPAGGERVDRSAIK